MLSSADSHSGLSSTNSDSEVADKPESSIFYQRQYKTYTATRGKRKRLHQLKALLVSCFGSKPKQVPSGSSLCTQQTPAAGHHDATRSPLVLDLRAAHDYEEEHVRESVSAPLVGLSPKTANGDLFGDATAVHWACQELESLLKSKVVSTRLEAAKSENRQMFVVCYDGDASRLATAILRTRGMEAFSVLGGMRGLGAQTRT